MSVNICEAGMVYVTFILFEGGVASKKNSPVKGCGLLTCQSQGKSCGTCSLFDSSSSRVRYSSYKHFLMG